MTGGSSCVFRETILRVGGGWSARVPLSIYAILVGPPTLADTHQIFINAPEGCRHGTHTSKHARTAPSVRPSVPLSVAVRQTDRRQPEGRVSSRAGLPMTTLGSPCDECNKRHYCLLKGLRAISKTKRVYE